MTYRYQFINRLDQFGQANYDAIYTDDAGILPQVRVNKTFPIEMDNPDGMAAIAADDIADILAGQAGA